MCINEEAMNNYGEHNEGEQTNKDYSVVVVVAVVVV